MRWAALGVDFEMFGKDHQTNAVDLRPDLRHPRRPRAGAFRLRAVPRRERPEDLEVEGQRADHRRVADLCADREPRPLHVPEAAGRRRSSISTSSRRRSTSITRSSSAYPRQEWKERLGNPVWHMHDGNPPAIDLPVPFALLLNLVSASNAHDKGVLWGFISRHAPGVTPQTHPELDRLAGYAIRYFDDFVKPTKIFRAPDEVERAGAGGAVGQRSARCRPTPTARRSRTPRSTSRARSSATRTIPSRARKAGPASRSPSSR